MLCARSARPPPEVSAPVPVSHYCLSTHELDRVSSCSRQSHKYNVMHAHDSTKLEMVLYLQSIKASEKDVPHEHLRRSQESFCEAQMRAAHTWLPQGWAHGPGQTAAQQVQYAHRRMQPVGLQHLQSSGQKIKICAALASALASWTVKTAPPGGTL